DDQVHAASAAVARLSELVIRLEAASAQVEGMLAKAGEARIRLQSEMDRAPAEAGRVAKIAGEGALEEFRSKLSSEWETNSAQLLAEMKRRVEEQVSSAITAFGREAGAHLARLTQESGPKLESKQKQTVSATKEQIAQVAESAANEFRGTIGKLAEETSTSLNSRMQSSLEKTAADAAERLGQSLREQSVSLLQGEASPIPRLRQQMEEEAAGASMQFKGACAKEIERASSNLKEEMMKAVSVLTGAAADANSGLWESAKAIKHDLAFKGEKIRTQLTEISSASEEGFKNYLHVRVKGAQEELQMNLRVLADKSAQEFSERLQKQTDSLLETFGPQLQRQAEDAAVLCKGSLESAARESLSETRKQVAGLTGEALGTFSAEMRSQMEQFRNQLGTMIRETFASGAQELQNRLRQAGEEEARAALSRIQSEGAAASERVVAEIRDRASEAKAENERVLAEIKDRSTLMNAESESTVASTRERAEAAARQASDAVYKQLGMATVVLKDWSDQTASRLESQFRESMAAFEKHVQELANRSLEANRIQSEATLQEARHRLEQATRILRGEAADPQNPSS
ncbi:MAG TPA: hypothetical protein VFM21_04260, partial [Terriglobia bacterium]|nr:hypothetical protein [Terriglobia bacterium]